MSGFDFRCLEVFCLKLRNLLNFIFNVNCISYPATGCCEGESIVMFVSISSLLEKLENFNDKKSLFSKSG